MLRQASVVIIFCCMAVFSHAQQGEIRFSGAVVEDACLLRPFKSHASNIKPLSQGCNQLNQQIVQLGQRGAQSQPLDSHVATVQMVSVNDTYHAHAVVSYY